MTKKEDHRCIVCAIMLQAVVVLCLFGVGLILRDLAEGWWSERMIRGAINLLGVAIGFIVAIFQLRWSEWRRIIHERKRAHR